MLATGELRVRAEEGPLAHGFAADQRWTLGQVKTLSGKLVHAGYTVEGVWKLMRRHGWPARCRCARRGNATMRRPR
jgi:hypothetical protein